MARGGNREGSQGKILANAAQGAAPKVNFEGGYGADTAQAPLQAARVAPATPQAQPAAPAQYAPPSRPVMRLDAPDDRPWEDVSTGLGAEGIGMPSGPSVADKLWQLYRAHPNPDLLELLLDA